MQFLDALQHGKGTDAARRCGCPYWPPTAALQHAQACFNTLGQTQPGLLASPIRQPNHTGIAGHHLGSAFGFAGAVMAQEGSMHAYRLA